MTPSINPDTCILALGIDAGGTQTRWALINEKEETVIDGVSDGMTAMQIGGISGRAQLQMALNGLATTVLRAGKPAGLCAGLTGFSGAVQAKEELSQMLASAFHLPLNAIQIKSDIEIAYLDTFAPGEGYLVYAGTGSIAAFVTSNNEFHRAGGRGVILDDGGGGYWIAREALRHIWRKEDERPGSWRDSVMASKIFDYLGSSDWSASRSLIYEKTRGEMGRLALAVAASADSDTFAYRLLQSAGEELARLANAMIDRYGSRPIALAGRVQELHPVIAQTMEQNLQDQSSLKISRNVPHLMAARMAMAACKPTQI